MLSKYLYSFYLFCKFVICPILLRGKSLYLDLKLCYFKVLLILNIHKDKSPILDLSTRDLHIISQLYSLEFHMAMHFQKNMKFTF